MKYCSRCKQTKPADEFFKCKARPDGLNGICKECDKEKERIRRQSHPERYAAMHLKRDRVKLAARTLVRSKISQGELKREPCERCGSTNVHAHHDDYSKPLQVRWLCPTHHAEVHREARQ